MTIAIGFLCLDGVVLASDRQITGDNRYTFPERKYSTFAWQNGCGVVVYAGSRDAHTAFDKTLDALLPADLSVDAKEAQERFGAALKSLPKKEIFSAIFGFWVTAQQRPSLLLGSTDGRGNSRVTESYDCEVIGWGDSSLSRYILGNITSVDGRRTVAKAKIYCVRIISAASVYEAQYVGGGIDVLSVSHCEDLGRIGITVLDAGPAKAWEEEINLFDYWSNALFTWIIDRDRALNVDQFMEAIDRFRKWAIAALQSNPEYPKPDASSQRPSQESLGESDES
jgi:hypothetical protein